MSETKRIEGFVAAPYTPMDTEGAVVLEQIRPYADHLRESGVGGAFVNGTTGEGYSLTASERMQVAERWTDAQDDRLQVIVHVGAESVSDAKAFAKHAQASGASAIGAMSPVFYKPNLDQMVAWTKEVAGAAPELPFYYYHMPGMTGAAFSLPAFLERAINEIPTLRGVKFTHDDLMEYRICCSLADGHFDMLFGRDEILLGALAMGARGMVGSTYNYAMALFRPLINAFANGRIDEARELQIKVVKLVQILIANGGGVVCGKSLMSGVGLDLGPCRVPNGGLSPAQAGAALEAARSLGTFQ